VKSLLIIPAFVFASCICPINHLTAQTLTWTAPISDESVVMDADGSAREAPAAAVFNHKMYMAYMSTTVGTSPGNPYVQYVVYYGSNSGGVTDYEPLGYITNGNAWTNLNPSLQSFNGSLYLALADNFPSGGPQYSPAYFAMNTAGQWGPGTGFPTTAAPAGSSVGMATDGTTYLYLGYRNINDNTLVLCRMNTSQVITCTNFPGTTTMGFAPGLTYLNGSLYIAFQNLSSHNLDYYVSTDQGQTIGNLITTAANDQTSTTPSLALHNGYIYMGFRTNDGDHKFIYKATSNGGTSWTASTESIGAGYSMGGNPVLVDGTNLTNYPQYLYNIFARNGSPYYVFTSFGQ
jgi:hypothetical protein